MTNQYEGHSVMASAQHAEPIADPAPLAFAGFAASLFMLGLVYSNVLGRDMSVVLPLALAFGGVVQVLAGMWEFRRGNTFGAVAFSAYGAFWVTYFLLIRYFQAGLPSESGPRAVGYFVLSWTIFTAYMLIASMRTNGAVFSVFLTLTVTLAVATAGWFAQSVNTIKAAGIVAIITAALCWYVSFASVVNTTWKKNILPVWPLDK